MGVTTGAQEHPDMDPDDVHVCITSSPRQVSSGQGGCTPRQRVIVHGEERGTYGLCRARARLCRLRSSSKVAGRQYIFTCNVDLMIVSFIEKDEK